MNWETHFEFFPFVVQLAWIADDKEKNYIIKPRGYNIPLYTTNIHGISTEKALAEGSYFEDIIDEFLVDCLQADLICAHNIYFDTSIIKANILRYMGKEFYLSKADQALHKTKRIDTMRKTIDLLGL
jgi:DNA polymerase III epsilon subunit-like protein